MHNIGRGAPGEDKSLGKKGRVGRVAWQGHEGNSESNQQLLHIKH